MYQFTPLVGIRKPEKNAVGHNFYPTYFILFIHGKIFIVYRLK